MKKTTISAILCLLLSFTAIGQGYDMLSGNKSILHTKVGVSVVDGTTHQRQPVLDSYTVREIFELDYETQTGHSLTNENFSGAPAGINTCGTIISSSGDDCFAPGELIDGFTVTSSMIAGGGNVTSITAGTIGNSINLVGATTFAEFTIVNFTMDIYAVGMDIWNNASPIADFRVYDSNGNLMDSFTLSNTVGNVSFFGVIADEPIGRIEIQEGSDGGELFGKLSIGEFSILGSSEYLKQNISIYPNPVQNILTISASNVLEIENLVIYNALGQKMNVQFLDGQVNLSKLISGVYFISINTSAGTLTRKLIKR